MITFAQLVDDALARVSGPLKFRLVLQPTMAILFAIRDGLRDTRSGRPAYFWTIFTEPQEREAMLKNGWHSVGKVFILAVVLDVVYQFIVHRWRIYFGVAAMVALILTVLPYMALRGPVNRIARITHRVRKEPSAGD